MKKYLLSVLLIIFAVTVLPVFAGQPTEFEIPEIGTEISGFVVTDLSYMESVSTDVVTLEHQKTGSVLYWLANDNIERSYVIAFHTVPLDDTGLPHVFEHASLTGSRKYPGANTYSEMNQKTSSTFLNAITTPISTIYPMSTTSEKQLLKYIDFYMNGVTDPLAVSDKFSMMEEAYRYELDDPEDDITLQGIVYSEMLGHLPLTDWAEFNFFRMVYPGSYLNYVYGGDPEFIPDMTLEDLRKFHETYYHPSNATMYLSGDIYLPDFLELLDSEFLSKYDRKEVVIEDSNYTAPEPGYYEQVFSYAAESGTPTEKGAVIYYGFPCKVSSYTDMELLDYVCRYMNDESSPLQRMMKEKLPEALVSMNSDRYPEGKVLLNFKAQSIDESDKDTFKAVCDDALAQLLENGVSEEVLKGILIHQQFVDLTKLDDSQVYFTKMYDSMTEEWIIFGDRDAWKLSEDFYSHLTDLVTVENLNAAAKKYWSDLDTAVMAITVPVPGLKEEKDAALRTKLDEMKAAMTPEEVAALVEETRAFKAYMEKSNQITMPEELNALTVATLPEEVSYKPASETAINGIRVITSEIDSPLIRVGIRVDASSIPFEDLLDLVQFADLLQNVETERYTREELPAKIANVSAGMSMYYEVMQNPQTHDLENYFYISWFALPETLEESFNMVEEILYHSDFGDYDYIRSDAAQTYALLQSYLEANSFSYAIQASVSSWSKVAKFHYYLNLERMDYLNKLSRMTDEEMDALVQKFAVIRDTLLNKKGAVLTVMGNYENIIRSAVLGYQMIDKFSDAEQDHIDYCAMINDLPLHTGIVTGGNVVFNLAAGDMTAAGYDKDDGGVRIILKILDDKLFYPEIRVKNSAYGGYAGYITNADNVIFFYSYDDPKVAETYAVYESAGDFLRNVKIDKAEMEGYITSVYGDLTYPIGPLSAALTGIEDKMNGEDTYTKKLKMIRDIKVFTPEDVARYADLAEAVGSADGSRATVGSKTLIEANDDLFEYISYDFLGSEDEADTEESVGPNAAEEPVDANAALVAAIENLSPEEIESMLKEMDEDDLKSLVGYVMDSFTNDEGKVDADKIFALVGAFMNKDWSEEEIAEAVEELEAEAEIENAVEESMWESVLDSFYSELNEENLSAWVSKVLGPAASVPAETQEPESGNSLTSLLQGMISAFVEQSSK